MTIDLVLLACTLVLALAQVMLPAFISTLQLGVSYNAGARDAPEPEVGVLVRRLRRAQANLFETLPLFAAAILIAHVSGRAGALSVLGAQLYFWARLLYVPLYAAGVPYLRSMVWLVSLLGLVLVFAALLIPELT